MIQLTNNLSNEIQNIRKEVSESSEKNRTEIETKLSAINKEIKAKNPRETTGSKEKLFNWKATIDKRN